MKKIYLVVLALMTITLSSLAQVTVTGDGAGGSPYASLATAITAVNAVGTLTQPTTITTTISETAPIGGYSITTTGSAVNTLIISGGGNTITAFTPQASGSINDAIFKIIGGDYITIQGFVMLENPSNTTIVSNNMTEWGVALLYATTTNGAQNNTIQNNTISLNRTYLNTFGIYSNTRHSATLVTINAEVTSAAGSNSFNKIYGNTISNVNYGIVFIGAGTTIAAIDNGNDIGGSSAGTGNNITNWGGGAALSSFVSLTASNYCIFNNQQINDNVSYNTITSAALTQSVTVGAILKNYSVASPTSGTITTTINNNTVTVTNNPTATTTGSIIGINNQGLTPLLSTATFSLNNNTVQNCVLGGSTSTTNGLTVITNLSLPGTINMNNNSVINNAITATSATTGILSGISNSGASGTVNINSNIIRNFASTSSSGQIQTIGNTGAVVTALNINNNQLGNASGGLFSTSTATSGTLFGILSSGGAATCALSIQNNDIRGITYSIAASAAHAYIQNSATTSSQNISSNTFTNLNVNTTGNVTFISNSVSAPSVGFKIINGNSIVTAFNKAGAGGTVTLYGDGGSSTATAGIQNNNNNFSNITLTGNTTMAGWFNNDGTGGTPIKTITGNSFSNWTCGTSTVNVLQTNFGNPNSISNNNISNITGQSIVVGLTVGSSGTVSTLNISTNTITGLSSTGAASTVTGISNAVGATTLNISSNIINTLSSTSTTATVAGISSSTSSNIFLNTINTLSSLGTTSGVSNGIMVTGGAAHSIYKNKIYDLLTSGIFTTTPGVNGIVLSGAATSVTANVFNNLIGDLRATNANSTDAIRGLSITATGTTSNYNVYYNSVFINATSTGTNFGTSGIFHAASATATTAVLNLRNNIIYNYSTPSGTGLTVAFRRSSGIANTLNNYAVTSNNNDFYAGTPAVSRLIYSDGTSTAQTIALYKAGVFTAGTIAPRDANSVSDAFAPGAFFQSVTGSSPDFLKYQTGTAFQSESGAVNIAGYTDDYINTVRFGNPGYIACVPASGAPDMGAWELCGIIADLTAPAISYTALGNTSCLTDRTLTPVTITDASGVNIAATTRPRLYFKKSTDANAFAGNTSGNNGWKYVEATGAGGSPFSFTTDYSLLQAPVALADVIQYFVVAADAATPTPNVGINSGTFVGAIPTTVDLQGQGVISIGGSPASYTLTAAGISGTVTIGGAGTYLSLTGVGGLFSVINTGGISGNLTVNLLDASIAETGANALNAITYNGCAAAPYSIIIKPDVGVNTVLNGSVASGALIKLNGADNVTIDGSNNGTNSRNLTITNTSATSPTAVWYSSLGNAAGATDNTIKNCIINTGSIAATSYGIFAGGATIGTAGSDNDNLTIQNNLITKAYYGINIPGNAAGVNDNLLISGNTIGSTVVGNTIGFEALVMSQANSAVVTGNDIFGITTTSSFDAVVIGTGVTNSSFTANKIHDLINNGTNRATGINVSSGAAAGLTFANNVMYGIINNGTGGNTFGCYGFYVTAGSGYNFYYNSINMSGDRDAVAATKPSSISAAMMVNAGTLLNIRDNIFVNTQTAATNSPKCYAIYSNVVNSAYTAINYNDYYANGAQAVLGFLTADQATIAAWRIATAQDVNSLAVDPAFNSTTNLIPLTGAPVVAAGTTIGGITTDILGAVRGVPPTMGAYENTGDFAPPAITYALLGNTNCTLDRTLTPVTVTDASGVNITAGTRPRLYFKKSTDANTYAGNTSGNNGWKYVEATGAGGSPFSFTTDYSLLQAAVAPADIIQYFVVAEDLAGTPNVAINSGTFAATPATVGLSAAAFPIGGTINSYTILAGLPTTITIGATGDYASLTGAGPTGLFNAINNSVLTGNTIVNILDASVIETGAVALNQISSGGCATASYTLLIKPNAGQTSILTGVLANNAIVRILSSNVTIDGSNNGGTSRNLSITNTSVTAPLVVLLGSTGTTPISNTILKNSIIINGVNTSSAIVVSDGATAGNAGYFSNVTVQNNSIQLAYIGIYCNAVVTAGNGNGLTLTGNDLSTSGVNAIGNLGIYVQGVSGATLSNNLIGNFEGVTGETDKGIWLATGTTNSNIFGNRITNLNYIGTGGYGGQGIYISTGATAAGLKVYNNMIANLSGDGWNYTTIPTDNTVGILLTGAQTGIEIYYNSINLYGNTLNQTSAMSMGIFLNTGSVADIRDNIINNNLGLLAATGYGAVGIYAATNNAQFNAIDYNDYYVNPSGSGVKFIGQIAATGSATLAAWQTATGQDVNSLNIQPNFVSATDLHLTVGTNCGLDGYGTPIAGITTDIDAQTRDAGAPDMGADEFTTTPAPSAIATASNCNTKNVSPLGTLYVDGSCNLISKVLPSGGGTAVSGKIKNCVTLDGTQLYFNGEPYVQRHHDIEPATSAATATAKITLYYTNAEFVNYNTNNPVYPKLPTVAGGANGDANRANVRITQFHGIATTIPSTPGNYSSLVPRELITPGAANVFYNGTFWEVTFDVTGFSGFYLHTTNTNAPLPVSINYFTGVRQNNNHILNWKVTCNITPRVTITLERSADSRNYTAINSITADALRCNQPFDYTDANPLQGINYYRLKMVDADGKVTYSTTVALLNAVKGFTIVSIAPNPVTTNGDFRLNIASAQSSKMDITIVDMQGRVVNRQTVTVAAGSNSIPMNVSNLSAGTYFLSGVVADEKSTMIKFVKQ